MYQILTQVCMCVYQILTQVPALGITSRFLSRFMCMYVYMYLSCIIYTHTHTHTHTHLHTHTHTHTRQEDLDNMTKELDMWAKDKDVQTQLLEDEKRQSEIEVDRCLRERGGRCSA